MEDRSQDLNSSHSDHQRSNQEPVRSRWTPKPEQILILETIFNSGMVNPPKEETVRIRKLLEKFGAVGDANVFYWFQNRRSRSRRRQRQMQATLVGANGGGYSYHSISTPSSSQLIMSGAMSPDVVGSSNCSGGCAPPPLSADSGSSYHTMMAGSPFYGGGFGIGRREVDDDNFGPIPTTQMGGGYTKPDTISMFCQSDTSNLNYPSAVGSITVFINGLPTEVPMGAIDMKALFGENTMLVHSSGVPVPVNDFGFLMQVLEQGESYFLVSRTT